MAADQDSFSKGFDSTSNLGAEGSMARQTAPPGSTRIASTAGVPKPATVTIRERPQPPPASAQVTIKERPQPPPGPAKVTIRERPRPPARRPQRQRQAPQPNDDFNAVEIQRIRERLRKAGFNPYPDRPTSSTTTPAVEDDFNAEEIAHIKAQVQADERAAKKANAAKRGRR